MKRFWLYFLAFMCNNMTITTHSYFCYILMLSPYRNLVMKENNGNGLVPNQKHWIIILYIVRLSIVTWVCKQIGGLWALQAMMIAFKPRSSSNGLFHLQLLAIICILGPIHFFPYMLANQPLKKTAEYCPLLRGWE